MPDSTAEVVEFVDTVENQSAAIIAVEMADASAERIHDHCDFPISARNELKHHEGEHRFIQHAALRLASPAPAMVRCRRTDPGA